MRDGWLETYRGCVNAWETDTTAHFTVAYYFDRFSDATLNAMESLGLGPGYIAAEGRTCASVDCYVRYLAELRAGDGLHIESAPIAVDERKVTLGHKVYNSETGQLACTLEQLLLHFDMKQRKAVPMSEAQQARVRERIVAWDGDPRQERPNPAGDDGFAICARDTVKPWEIDLLGHMGFQFFVHRFSAAGLQLLGRIGCTSSFMREQKRGFSTFEFQLRFRRELKAGDRVAVKSGLTMLGNSSVCVLHRMYNEATGELSAQLSQFGVLLDMEARRPTRIPDAIREQAQRFLATG